MTDKMREEFEAHMRDHSFDHHELAHDEACGYHSLIIDIAWGAWQAAYAAGQQAEREACAKVCDRLAVDFRGCEDVFNFRLYAAELRARNT